MRCGFFTTLINAALAVLLAGCAAAQLGQDTTQMVNGIDKLREDQVLANLSRAIDDPDFVPVQIVLGTGQAEASVGLQPTMKNPGFNWSQKSKEIDVGLTDTWNAQWQMTPVADTNDLRNLRDLYDLVTSAHNNYEKIIEFYQSHPGSENLCTTQDALIASVWRRYRVVQNWDIYYRSHTSDQIRSDIINKKIPTLDLPFHDDPFPQCRYSDMSNLYPADYKPASPSHPPSPPISTVDQALVAIASAIAAGGKPSSQTGPTSSQAATWAQGLQTIELGDSIGCKIFQQDTVNRFVAYTRETIENLNDPAHVTLSSSTDSGQNLPFRRWLYWRVSGGQWEPNYQPADGPVISLHGYGKYELGTTSRACFDDFVALMQSATPSAAATSSNGPKISIPTQ